MRGKWGKIRIKEEDKRMKEGWKLVRREELMKTSTEVDE